MKNWSYYFFGFFRHLEHVFFSMSPQYSQKFLPQTLHFTSISSGSPHMWQLIRVYSGVRIGQQQYKVYWGHGGDAATRDT